MRKLILSLIAAAIAGTNGMAQSGFTRAGWEPEIVAYYHGDDMADYVTDFIELNPAVFEDLDNASTPWSFSPWTNAKENRDKIGAAGQRVGKETAWAVTSIPPYDVYFYDKNKNYLTNDPPAYVHGFFRILLSQCIVRKGYCSVLCILLQFFQISFQIMGIPGFQAGIIIFRRSICGICQQEFCQFLAE